jgi:hypothetical protein
MCINITESVLLINHKTRGELSKYHNQRRLLRYIVDRDMSKKMNSGVTSAKWILIFSKSKPGEWDLIPQAMIGDS